ncbi:MAG: spermine synthase [Chthoniobacteraceae bacterium]|nr:spermine synthase [Chthoniobacteraceae bacterium]
MKPFSTLAQTRTPNGAQLTLQEHDGQFYLKLNGRQLMSSTAASSELRIAELACDAVRNKPGPSILIGGLGLGFSLRRVLELVGLNARVHVAELLQEVIDWNRQFLTSLNGALLEDPRVEVFAEDVFKTIGRAPAATYDAILLDVDNGPNALVAGQNSRLYDRFGFGRIARALKLTPPGRVAYWSAVEDPAFAKRLSRSGFKVEAFGAKSHPSAKRLAHTIYVGERVEVK